MVLTRRILTAFLGLCLPFSFFGLRVLEGESVFPPSAPLEEVEKRVAEVPPQHPRLLISGKGIEELRASIPKSPLARSIAYFVVKEAEFLGEIPPVQRRLQGRRLLGQSRTCLKRVVTLAMAYQLTGAPRHARRAEREMLAAAGFRDWNPSHFLDVAEMTLALAIGYDWLFDELSESSKREIREAIVNKSLLLPFETEHKGWVRSHNNWGQVCHAGLTAGALAILEEEPELAARTIHNAIHNVTYSMAAYAPNGSYPEGPGYWAYGTSYNVILIALLNRALGTDFGLSQAPGFAETGGFLPLVTGPSGLFFNYADGGSRRSPQPALFWFAARYGRPDWLIGEGDRFEKVVNEPSMEKAARQSDRLLPLSLIWLQELKNTQPLLAHEREKFGTEIEMPLHWMGRGDVPVAVHRSSWTDPNRTFIGLKGGSPSANHGQMDIGSFVLDADGVRWAVDLGAEGYHGIESRGMNLWDRSQDSDRWTIFRQMNRGHNTLLIDEQLQVAAGKAEFVQFSEASDFPHSLLDMSPVYSGQVKTALRGIGLVNSREVLVQDHLTGVKPGSTVRWAMVTPGSPGDNELPNELVLSQEGKSLGLKILSPNGVGWSILDISKPPREWDSPNPGLRMIVFEAQVPASGELSIAVLATPGSVSDSVRADFELQALDKWGP